MNCHRFFAAKVCQPAKPETKWTTWFSRFFNVLVKSLKRSNSEPLGRHLLRLAHHLTLIGAVTMQCDQQRRWTSRWTVQIVIKIDPGREVAVNVGLDGGHWTFILFILCSVSTSLVIFVPLCGSGLNSAPVDS
jgi:hypothetical protein